jgi:hypothetical protein
LRSVLVRVLLIAPLILASVAGFAATASKAEAAECTRYSSGFEVCGAIRHRYETGPGLLGILGLPTTNELTTPDSRGRYNHFERGSIYWTPQTGAWEVYGAIRERWKASGWERGPLGYPTTGELPSQDGGRYNYFQHGAIYWRPGLDAVASLRPRFSPTTTTTSPGPGDALCINTYSSVGTWRIVRWGEPQLWGNPGRQPSVHVSAEVRLQGSLCGVKMQVAVQSNVCGFWGCDWHDRGKSPVIDLPHNGSRSAVASMDCRAGRHSYRPVLHLRSPALDFEQTPRGNWVPYLYYTHLSRNGPVVKLSC